MKELKDPQRVPRAIRSRAKGCKTCLTIKTSKRTKTDKALRARREEPKPQRAAKPPSVAFSGLTNSSMLEIEVDKDGFHCQQNAQSIGKNIEEEAGTHSCESEILL